ncbi:hypothetical protein H181DRAFT_05248 [Streptomyces sp. WMMB 714]|uniref:hypothetical protein n=1 Tax=Streptomyces sp. WMMB 714 TaxID=1286822 RepID=UPI0005F8203A|nr:hypothetical protein [Streptomyces sp. WMMB 714]SCK56359.1 hypothetical protein H181DRAFT_05248 [Streptomyces sp. WMMB 714]
MRTSARTAGAVAAIAAAALLVSGCGSSDEKAADDGGDGGKSDASVSSPEADPAATATAEKSQKPKPPSDGKDAKPPKVAGIWKAKGKQLVLTIAGDAVTLLRQESNCTGRVVDKTTLTLKCPGGTGEDRTNGTVGALKAESMKVSWNGGATDVYKRVADAPAKLPENPGDVASLLPQE